MLKRLLGIAPQPTEDGAFSPSPVALKLATSSTTDFDNHQYENRYTKGKRKVLMICTEERNMTMRNGKRFSTGNHPVEMLVPMLHLKNAGFTVDVMTPTGESVKIERWAMPEADEHVTALYADRKLDFERPMNLRKFVANSMQANEDYLAIFIPGGHGAMLGLPDNDDLKQLIHWSHRKGLFMLSICHGPAAFLAAAEEDRPDAFLYRGYRMAAFPDIVDKLTPLFGYMPGPMPWKFGEKLKNLGVTIINKSADGTCSMDRKLITGASPAAANAFGKLAAEALLEAVNT